MKHTDTPSLKHRLCALVAAGTLAASTMGAPLAAFAADAVEESAEGHTGTGATDVTVQLPTAGDEVGGSENENNPDKDHDSKQLGDNIAFTVPASINFVAKADGSLLAPAAASTYIENESTFAIHASSMSVEAADGWNLVESAAAADSDTKNAFDFKFGPRADQLKAVEYTDKKAVSKPYEWNMSYAVNDEGKHPADRVQLTTSGAIAHVEAGITGKTRLATIHTYVKQGLAARP